MLKRFLNFVSARIRILMEEGDSKKTMDNRYSVGSLGSLISSSSDGTSVDSSFMSMASSSSSGSLGYEIESEVGREALREMCFSALSRVLDFPDCQLEILLGYEEENSTGGNNVAKNITTSLRSMKRGLSSLYRHHHSRSSNSTTYPWFQVVQTSAGDEDTDGPCSALSFGTPLNEANQNILLQLITHMNMFVSREGLFRKSGNKGRMEQLVKGLEEGAFGNVILEASYNANDFASVLKQYFSELPEPLLLKRHLNAYLQAAALSTPSSMLRSLQLLMLLLPPVHRVVLQHLLDLLFQVTKSPNNKMDAHNLSLIFAPTLFLAARSETLPPDDLTRLSQLLAYMIDSSEDIFEVPPEVQVVAERYSRKRSKKNHLKMSSYNSSIGEWEEEPEEEEEGMEDVALDLYSTSCKRECVETFHETGKEKAMDEVAKLYELVKNMPDGPQKAHFMKRFDAANKTGCTPTSVPRQKHMSSLSRLKRSLRRNKENATPKVSATPKHQIQLLKPCFKKGSLASEFDKVEDKVEPYAAAAAKVEPSTPCNALRPSNAFRTPGDFATPSTSFVFKTPATPLVFSSKTQRDDLATPHAFKTPRAPPVGYKYRMIPTKSSLVTDV